MNVLLTSVGRRVSLLRAFRREISRRSPTGRVLAADASVLSAGIQDADGGFLVPPCSSPEYVPALLDIVRRERVSLIVPLIDPELEVLARERGRFLREGCHPVVSELSTVLLARDKRRSAERFRALGFEAPRSLTPEELERPERLEYPLFLKPEDGSSSVGAVALRGPDELRFHVPRTRRALVQTLEAGEEFTVDVLADLAGRALCAVPRRRLEVRAGEISKGRTHKDPVLMAESMRLVEALGGCQGCITLQCFRRPDGRVSFFEVNARFGGGYPLSDAAGANYPGRILDLLSGQSLPVFDGWQDGLVMLRYDDAIFVPGLR